MKIKHFLFGLLLPFICCTNNSAPKDALTQALLSASWDKIYQEFEKRDSALATPETIALLGHSAIMLNKTNESYILLKAIDLDSVRQEWLNWTNHFMKTYPNSAVSHYFRGDALMRDKKKDAALAHLNKAIDLNPDFELAYHARGVIHTIDGNIDNAKKDLNEACALDSTIAAFYVTRAVMFFNNNSFSQVNEDFSKALTLAPASALALNGKACITYVYNPDALDYYEKIDATAEALSVAKTYFNHPVFNTNNRAVLMELEDSLYLGQINNPEFRASDFLDWNVLQLLSNTENDLFYYILGRRLPEFLTNDFLIMLNSRLRSKNLFKNYVNQHLPDTIKTIFVSASDFALKMRDQNNWRTRDINRLILEKYYEGLIAHYLDRAAGTSIAKEFMKLAGQDARQGFNSVFGNAKAGISVSTSGVKAGISVPVKDLVSPIYRATKYATEIAAANINNYTAQRNYTKLTNDPIYQIRQNYPEGFAKARADGKLPFLDNKPTAPRIAPTQGGVKADGEGKVVDLSKPHSLICINGLAYDY